MLVAIYIVVAVLMFFAQLRNGFFMALMTAVFWPIIFPLMSVYIVFMMIRTAVK